MTQALSEHIRIAAEYSALYTAKWQRATDCIAEIQDEERCAGEPVTPAGQIAKALVLALEAADAKEEPGTHHRAGGPR